MIKIGLLGVGHFGKIHLKLLKEISKFQVIGFFDPNKDKSKDIEREFHVASFSSADELIAKCDAIDIVAPTVVHHELAMNALQKGKHVFIEKPLSNTLEEAREIMDVAAAAKVIVQVGHVERFNPAFLAVKHYINNPMFIETHRLAKFNPRGTDVSVVLDLMIHDIDIVLSVIKSKIKKVHANGVSIVSDSPDIASARLEFENGAVANLTASRISLMNMRRSRFFQHDAYMSVDFLEKKTEIIRIKKLEKEPDDPFAVTIDLGEQGKKQIFFDTPQVNEGNAIKMELESFADSIMHGTAPAVTAQDGYQSLDIAFKIMNEIQNIQAK